MKSKVLQFWAVFGGGVLVGLGFVTLVTRQSEPGITSLTCRPSAPAVVASVTSQPSILFWGNSLLFDGDWNASDYLAVNCARQGLSAAQARTLTPLLPDFAPDEILLAFGSVELGRHKNLNLPAFIDDVTDIVAQLSVQYTDSQIWLAGIPYTQTENPGWIYSGASIALEMNGQLARVEGAHYFDLSSVLDPLRTVPHTYDGLHLTSQAFDAWQDAISKDILGFE